MKNKNFEIDNIAIEAENAISYSDGIFYFYGGYGYTEIEDIRHSCSSIEEFHAKIMEIMG